MIWLQMFNGSRMYAAWRANCVQSLDSNFLRCELYQRGKLSGEKSRSYEVLNLFTVNSWNKVYCSGFECCLAQWECDCDLDITALLQCKLKFSQYDSPPGESAVSALFIGCKAVELLGCDHSTMKIKDNHGKHRVKIAAITCYWQWFWSCASASEEWNGGKQWSPHCWGWVQPFSSKVTTKLITSWQEFGRFSQICLWVCHILVDWHTDSLSTCTAKCREKELKSSPPVVLMPHMQHPWEFLLSPLEWNLLQTTSI